MTKDTKDKKVTSQNDLKPELTTDNTTDDNIKLKVENKTTTVDTEKLNELVTSYKEMREQITRLEATAHKGRTAKYDAQHEESTLDKVGINFLHTNDGRKIVTAWRMLEDELITNVNTGVMRADQRIRLFHEDEDDFTDIEYVNFKKLVKEEGEVIKDETEKVSGDRILTVTLPEYGKTIKINVIYVN